MIRCFDLAALAAVLAALAGCASLVPRLSGAALLGGYKLMDAPTSDVPLGAYWQQGYGPIGPGADAENVMTRRSFSSLTLSRAARRGVEIRIAEYLGLQPASSAKLSATISEISVASVADTAKLGLMPGDAFLSDAMKASRITISNSSERQAELVSNLIARGLTVTGRGSANGQDALSIEGADLFFAYRVRRLGKDDGRSRPVSRIVSRPRAPGW